MDAAVRRTAVFIPLRVAVAVSGARLDVVGVPRVVVAIVVVVAVVVVAVILVVAAVVVGVVYHVRLLSPVAGARVPRASTCPLSLGTTIAAVASRGPSTPRVPPQTTTRTTSLALVRLRPS